MSKRRRSSSRSEDKSPKRQKKNKDEDSGSEEEEVEMIKKSKPKNQLIDIKDLLLEGKKSRVGTLLAMGNNSHGQLGVSTKTKRGDVVVIKNMTDVNVIDFCAGALFTVIAETSNNAKSRRVWCMGTMNFTKDSKSKPPSFVKDDNLGNEPEVMETLSRKHIIQVSAGESHAAALTMEGEVFTWGIYKNHKGESIGFKSNRAKTEFQDEPEELHFSEPFVQIGSTANKTVALTDSGEIYEWGDTGLNKRTVGRHAKDSLYPQYVNIPKKVCKFFCSHGGESVFAIAPDGHVYAWGYDKFYQLGIYSKAYEDEKEEERKKREDERKKKKDEEDKKAREEGKKVEEPKKKPEAPKKKDTPGQKKPAPKKVDKYGGRKVKFNRPTDAHAINQFKKDDKNFEIKKIVCGSHHTVLLDGNGNAYAWGRNNFGQCGVNSKDDVIKEPTRVELDNVLDIATGGNHTLFVTKNGVYACGLAKDDRFNSKTDQENKPVKIEGLDKYKNIVGISCGLRHNLFFSE